MAGRPVREVWVVGVEDGQRRINRSAIGLMATGAVAGLDIMIGAIAQMTALGQLEQVLPMNTAKLIASFALGIAFMFITVGRSELFTENFLIPVAPVLAGRAPVWRVLRLWLFTAVFNIIGMVVVVLIINLPGAMAPETHAAVGQVSDTYLSRPLTGMIGSALIAGAVITVFTWALAAAETPGIKVAMSLLLGFVLGAPTLNHAIVGFGEAFWGVFAGTAAEGTYPKLLLNLGITVVFNTLGGMAFVTLTRLYQIVGEEEDGTGLEEIVEEDERRRAIEAEQGSETSSV